MASKINYRVWQFWQSLKGSPGEKDWEKAAAILTPPELTLFEQLPVPDQNHSLRVLKTLEIEGESDPDLLKAALLHDIGKARHPLRRYERVFAVLVRGVFPGLAAVWGEKEARGIQRALAVIQQHPAWGAELAQGAGCSQAVIWLIRHHEMEDLTGLLDQGGVELLRKLQKADNLN
jgi:putative nucleotidyltransferase with HDIG domain